MNGHHISDCGLHLKADDVRIVKGTSYLPNHKIIHYGRSPQEYDRRSVVVGHVKDDFEFDSKWGRKRKLGGDWIFSYRRIS